MMAAYDEMSDGELVERVLTGETAAFRPLFAKYYPALTRLAESRLGCRHRAADAVQETYFCAFKWLASYDSKYSFRTWLWAILLNQCRRQLGKQVRESRWQDEVDPDGQAASSELDPRESVELDERSGLLEELLSDLPTELADALRLRFFGGLKFQEIADVMRCSLSTAKNRVRRGLTRMSETIRENPTLSTVADPFDFD